MSKEEVQQVEQLPELGEFNEIMKNEGKEIRREKMDLSSGRRILDNLLKEGTITAEDKISDVLKVIDRELANIEGI